MLAVLLLSLTGTSIATARDQWIVGNSSWPVDTLVFPHRVGPGLTSAKYDLPDIPLKVSVLEMDLTNPYIRLETCLGADRSVGCESPVDMATRSTWQGHEVVAATNGDFYMTSPTDEVGLPLSGQVRNGELVLSSHNRACLVMDQDQHPYIDRLTFTGSYTTAVGSFDINLVNRMRYAYEDIADDQTILFTRSYGPTTYDATEGKMVRLRPASDEALQWLACGVEHCVVDSVFDAVGSVAIPDDGAILWLKGARSSHAVALPVGTAVDVSFSLTLNNHNGEAVVIDQLVGGSNHIIMQDGVVQDAWDDRHPRTAIGFNADTTRLLLVVVDGRNIQSVGVTLSELADIFTALGATTAVNLDGGGSSCMVVNGDVLNTPSGGRVRPVGNGCLLVSTAPADDTVGIISFEPRCYTLSVSARTTFDIWAYNRYGVLLSRDLQGCTFSCDPQVGHFDAEGVFHAAATPATGNLYATRDGITATQPVTIAQAQLTLVSDSVVIDRFHPFNIMLNGSSGYNVDDVDPIVAQWVSSDEAVCTVDTTGTVVSVADGRATVSGTTADWADDFVVRVENPTARYTTIENAPIDPATWTVTQSGGSSREATALDNGMSINFTGSSSRNPYIKLAKDVELWGLPDTLRVRLVQDQVPVRAVKMLVQTAHGERVTLERTLSDTVSGLVTLDMPVTEVCDTTDLGNFPLHLIYYYFSCGSVTSGQSYTLQIPGLELVYAHLPVPETLTGDVNGDGEVSVADVNAIIDLILAGAYGTSADVNADGEVTIADVNAVINIILNE